MSGSTPSLYVGTSGWYYQGWKGAFYPDGLPNYDMLPYYARQFGTVEINATFHRLPTENMVKGWHDNVPPEFLFAVKGSRRITHTLKLRGVDEAVQTLVRRIDGLLHHLGPILWQLPPGLHCDRALLEQFLAVLPDTHRHAIEFRHPSWLQPDIMDLLRRRGVAQVSISSTIMPANFSVTAPFVYVRLHGLEGGHHHAYTRDELAPWAEHLRRVLADGRTAFVYFNNDGDGHALTNAHDLLEIVQASTAGEREHIHGGGPGPEEHPGDFGDGGAG